jgi:hypothetical protein
MSVQPQQTQQTNVIRIRLHHGEQTELSPTDVERLNEELWLLVGAVRGALSAAAKLTEASKGMPTAPLDSRESDLVRRLLAKVRRPQPE